MSEDVHVHKSVLKLMPEFLLALGGNLPGEEGDVTSTLADAIEHLDRSAEFCVNAISDWFHTPAWPPGSGPAFVNGAARVATELPPEAVLARLHAIEHELGRARSKRWGPRICDLDLLAMGDLVLPHPQGVRRWMDLTVDEAATRTPDALVLPHPRLHERAFVLVPLNQIAPDWIHPILGQTTSIMLAKLPRADIEAVRPVEASIL